MFLFLLFTKWPWHALSQVTAVLVLLGILYHHHIQCQRQYNTFGDPFYLVLALHVIDFSTAGKYIDISMTMLESWCIYLNCLYLVWNSAPVQKPFMLCFWTSFDVFQIRGASHHRQESFNEMFEYFYAIVWRERCDDIFVKVWGEGGDFGVLKYLNILWRRFWWLTGCAVRGRKTKEKEAGTSYWKDTGDNSTIFK